MNGFGNAINQQERDDGLKKFIGKVVTVHYFVDSETYHGDDTDYHKGESQEAGVLMEVAEEYIVINLPNRLERTWYFNRIDPGHYSKSQSTITKIVSSDIILYPGQFKE